VTSAGNTDQSRGLIATIPVGHVGGTGVYTVEFTGDLGKCAVNATLTGATMGEITATPLVAAGNTTVTVRTASSAGALEDHPFHVTVSC
jgi:uncharacterized membrane protein (DUF441 family)